MTSLNFSKNQEFLLRSLIENNATMIWPRLIYLSEDWKSYIYKEYTLITLYSLARKSILLRIENNNYIVNPEIKEQLYKKLKIEFKKEDKKKLKINWFSIIKNWENFNFTNEDVWKFIRFKFEKNIDLNESYIFEPIFSKK